MAGITETHLRGNVTITLYTRPLKRRNVEGQEIEGLEVLPYARVEIEGAGPTEPDRYFHVPFQLRDFLGGLYGQDPDGFGNTLVKLEAHSGVEEPALTYFQHGVV